MAITMSVVLQAVHDASYGDLPALEVSMRQADDRARCHAPVSAILTYPPTADGSERCACVRRSLRAGARYYAVAEVANCERGQLLLLGNVQLAPDAASSRPGAAVQDLR